MRRLALVSAAFVVAALWSSGAAMGAQFGLNGFKVQYTTESGEPVLQAGSHPYAMKTSFNLNSFIVPEGPECQPREPTVHQCEYASGFIKDISIAEAEGLAGDQTTVPRCSTLDFLDKLNAALPNCPNNTAVGVVAGTIGFGELEAKGTREAPVYNLEPGPGTVAKLGFWLQGVPVTVDVGITSEAPYRIVATSTNTSQVLEVFGVSLTIWGVPAAPSHDAERGFCFVEGGSCPPEEVEGAPIREAPFLTVPRSCHGPLGVDYEIDSWLEPEAWSRASTQSAALSGCDALGFAPQISVAPAVNSASSPSGLAVEVADENPGLKDPSGIADADISGISLAMPPGITVNPSAAEGLGACTLAQYEALPGGPGCPESSKLGSVEAETPLLKEHPLRGTLYLAAQEDNPFGSLFALYVVFRDEELGIFIKQAGEVKLNEGDGANAGQILTTFGDIPEFPLSRIALRLHSGPRAPLATPPNCGTYSGTATMTPSSGNAPLVSSPSFEITSGNGGGPCPGGAGSFSPGFSAGTVDSTAGSYSPFVMHLTRQDGEPQLVRISAALPPGVTGKIAGVDRCSDAAIAAASGKSGRAELASSSCPSSSQIGSVEIGAGFGSALTYVPGKVYLAGPYQGAPFSVVVDTPAVAGPFDLGNVVVREPLRIDPLTARVTVDGATASPLPRSLKGVPVSLRDVRVSVDRSDFTVNSTSCEPTHVEGTLAGAALMGTSETLATRAVNYQASNCQALAFRPKLNLSLKGATKHAGHPALRAVLTYPQGGGYANIARAQVNLPHSEFIDQGNLNKTCTRPVLLEGKCPATSIYGKAKAWTPLLETPLEGPVYLVGGFGYKLPALVAELNGQVRVLLVGKVDSGPNEGIRNTFEAVPDAPVSRFVLEMKGGPKYSLLENSEDLCRRKQRASARFTAQNGRVVSLHPEIAVKCKKSGGRKKGSGHKHQKR